MNAPGWLAASRADAWKAFRETPPPRRSLNAWRFTDPARLLPPEPGPPAAEGPRRAAIPGPRPACVEVLDLAEGHAAARSNLGTAVPFGEGKLAALNFAAWRDGTFVRVPRGAAPDESLHLRFSAGESPFDAVRLLVVMEEESRLTLVDEYDGGPPSGPSLLNAVVELVLAPGAILRYIAVQDLAGDATVSFRQAARVAEGARAITTIFSAGGSYSRADIGAVLEGRGAESRADGVILASGSRHFDHRTVHLHRAPHTRSNFEFRAVLRDAARSVYTGSIVIAKDAPGCDAYQENRNLVLSERARADSIPELEIMNNDVQCTHGSATGPAEPSQVFYLESRGLPPAAALRTLGEGFVEPVLARCPEPFVTRLRERVAAVLESA